MISPPKHWQHWPRFCKRLFGLFTHHLGRAIQQYGLIDAEQCAASFAYYAVYGVFGSIMALLFWIYVSGVIVIFFGCFAATSELARSSLGIANSK